MSPTYNHLGQALSETGLGLNIFPKQCLKTTVAIIIINNIIRMIGQSQYLARIETWLVHIFFFQKNKIVSLRVEIPTVILIV